MKLIGRDQISNHTRRRRLWPNRLPFHPMPLPIDVDRLPSPLREFVLEALFEACGRAIDEAPQTSPVAHLLRGNVAAARGDQATAVAELEAAVASEDTRVVYEAAAVLVQLQSTAQLVQLVKPDAQHDYADVWKVAVARLAYAQRGPYTAALHAVIRVLRPDANTLLVADPVVLVRCVTETSSHKLVVPALELFYAEAMGLGYPNPMPAVRRQLDLLGIVPPAGASPAPAGHPDVMKVWGTISGRLSARNAGTTANMFYSFTSAVRDPLNPDASELAQWLGKNPRRLQLLLAFYAEAEKLGYSNPVAAAQPHTMQHRVDPGTNL